MRIYGMVKYAPILVMYAGKEEDNWLVATMESKERRIFGLCHRGTRTMTHMCYGLDYFKAEKALEHARTLGEGWFYFDAGTTRPEIKVSAEELEKAFVSLGLVQ